MRLAARLAFPLGASASALPVILLPVLASADAPVDVSGPVSVSAGEILKQGVLGAILVIALIALVFVVRYTAQLQAKLQEVADRRTADAKEVQTTLLALADRQTAALQQQAVHIQAISVAVQSVQQSVESIRDDTSHCPYRRDQGG